MPLLAEKSTPIAGLIGGWIVAADGYTDRGDTGDTEAYNPSASAWKSVAPDPTPRDGECGGSIGGQLYVASGNNNGPVVTLTDSFNALSNTWTRLADIPQATLEPGYAVYKGKLYCFGGAGTWLGPPLNNVQIYQP